MSNEISTTTTLISKQLEHINNLNQPAVLMQRVPKVALLTLHENASNSLSVTHFSFSLQMRIFSHSVNFRFIIVPTFWKFKQRSPSRLFNQLFSVNKKILLAPMLTDYPMMTPNNTLTDLQEAHTETEASRPQSRGTPEL